MTWQFPISLRKLLRIWHILAPAVAFAGIEISVGLLSLPGPAAEAPPRCAALFAQAFGSPNQPVRGSFDCQDDHLQYLGAEAGYAGDDGIQRYAQRMLWTQARPVGATGSGGWIYQLDGLRPTLLIVWIDQSGQVYRFDTDRMP